LITVLVGTVQDLSASLAATKKRKATGYESASGHKSASRLRVS
jgi:hypothetical protein